MKSILADPKEQETFIKSLPEKINQVKEIAKKKQRKVKLFCTDEASLRRDGTIHYGWYLRGVTPEIPESNGRFESIKMFGAVDPLKGDFSLKRAPKRITTVGYADFLISLAKKHSNIELIIMDDNAPWHSEKKLMNILQEKEINNVHIIRFPKYSSKMNPCEKLWKWLRETVTHCKYYSDLKSLMEAIWRFYRRAWNNKELAKIRFKTEMPLPDICESL